MIKTVFGDVSEEMLMGCVEEVLGYEIRYGTHPQSPFDDFMVKHSWDDNFVIFKGGGYLEYTIKNELAIAERELCDIENFKVSRKGIDLLLLDERMRRVKELVERIKAIKSDSKTLLKVAAKKLEEEQKPKPKRKKK